MTFIGRFQLRGYTDHQAKSFSAIVDNRIFADEMVKDTLSVRFYPLSGENADYNGMAKIYRGYLSEAEKPSGKKTVKPIHSINLIGGMEIQKSFLGVPYKTVYPTTSVTDAEEIIRDMSKSTDNKLVINLLGFGSTGIDIGELAGGFEISNKIGSEKELKGLAELCKDKDYSLYMDFDIVRFSSSANGFSTFFDAVKTAGNQKNYSYFYDKSVKDELKAYKYKLLLPDKLKEASEKLTKSTKKWGLTGISLSTASSLSYSDYSSPETAEYFAKSGFDKAVTSAIAEIKKNNYKFCASDANVYAAQRADVILDAPTASSKEYAFTEDIPFYQMVFSGLVPMTTEGVNISVNPDKTVLKAVESGMGLNYTVIASWDNSLISAEYPYFYSSRYSDVKDKIMTQYDRLDDYYKKISGAVISSHRVLESGLRETIFDNGVAVYVNYGNEAIKAPAGEIAAESFKVLEKPI